MPVSHGQERRLGRATRRELIAGAIIEPIAASSPCTRRQKATSPVIPSSGHPVIPSSGKTPGQTSLRKRVDEVRRCREPSPGPVGSARWSKRRCCRGVRSSSAGCPPSRTRLACRRCPGSRSRGPRFLSPAARGRREGARRARGQGSSSLPSATCVDALSLRPGRRAPRRPGTAFPTAAGPGGRELAGKIIPEVPVEPLCSQILRFMSI